MYIFLLTGTGYVCNTYKGSSPYPVEMVRMFNFSDKVLKRYVRLVSLVFFSFLSSLSNCSRSIWCNCNWHLCVPFLMCRIVQSSINELSSAKTASTEGNNQQEGVCKAENNINASCQPILFHLSLYLRNILWL